MVLVLVAALAACSVDVPEEPTGGSAGAARTVHDPALAAQVARGCPSWDTEVPYPGGDLDTGAASVRLCPGEPIVYLGNRYSLSQVQATEQLTTGVDDLVALVNGLPAPDTDQFCFSDGGPRLTYWFTYPDDRVSAVVFERFGCRSVLTGEEDGRLGGTELEAAFADALVAQRSAAAPPSVEQPQPRCRELQTVPVTSLPVTFDDLASATACLDVGTGERVVEEVPLTDPELDRFRRAAAAAPEVTLEETTCSHEPETRLTTLMVVTRWGDRAAYQVDPCGRVFSPRDPHQASGAATDTPVRLLTSRLERVLGSWAPGRVVRYSRGEGRIPREP